MSILQFHKAAGSLFEQARKLVNGAVKSTEDLKPDGTQHGRIRNLANQTNELFFALDNIEKEDLIDPDADHERVFLELDRATAEAIIEAVNIATISDRFSDQSAERAQDATTRLTDALVD